MDDLSEVSDVFPPPPWQKLSAQNIPKRVIRHRHHHTIRHTTPKAIMQLVYYTNTGLHDSGNKARCFRFNLDIITFAHRHNLVRVQRKGY